LGIEIFSALTGNQMTPGNRLLPRRMYTLHFREKGNKTSVALQCEQRWKRSNPCIPQFCQQKPQKM